MSAIKWMLLIVLVVIVAIVLWLYIGLYPQRLFDDTTKAGAYADSFGVANSFFSSLGFAFIVLALILQMKEIHDAGKTQAEQGVLQARQMEALERTARIQESIRLDSIRKLAMDAFLAINRDTLRFKHAFLAWHPENRIPTKNVLTDREGEMRLKQEYFNAFTILRSNCLRIGLLFHHHGDTLGKEIQELYALAHSWTEMTEGFPSLAKCENEMNLRIRRIEDAMRPLWERLNTDA